MPPAIGQVRGEREGFPQLVYTAHLFGVLATRAVLDLLGGRKVRPRVIVDVNAYALMFAVLLLTGGKLADLLGRRRIFLLGLAFFPHVVVLRRRHERSVPDRRARAVRGVGAALMLPATLSIISVTFPPRERGTAIGT